jgi:hypothetical protein
MICSYHLCTNELTGKQTRFCSKNCSLKYHVANRRRAIKRELIEYAGGKCAICGYDRCSGALQFHHLQPELKEFGIADKGLSRGIDKAKIEVDKCILVCANCHAELESGYITLDEHTG